MRVAVPEDGQWNTGSPVAPLTPELVLIAARSIRTRSISQNLEQSKLIDQAAEALGKNDLKLCKLLLEQAESFNSVAKDQYHLRALLEYLQARPDSAISYAYDELRAYPNNQLCRLFLEQLICERTHKPIPTSILSDSAPSSRQTSLSRPLRLGSISSWGTKCGIGIYAEDMVRNSPDQVEHIVFGKRETHYLPQSELPKTTSTMEPEVLRPFHDISLGVDNLEELYQAVIASNVEAVNFQFNYSFFAIQPFCRLLERLKQAGITVIVTFHATTDGEALGPVNIEMLAPCGEYISLAVCFKQTDVERLSAFLPAEKIWKTNLPVRPFAPLRRSEVKQARQTLGLDEKVVIAQHGFLLPNKGVELILEALGVLKQSGYTNFHFLSVTAAYSNMALTQSYINQLIPYIQRYDLANQVTFFTEFLPHDEVYKLLSLSDIIAFPYTTSSESASAAIRNAIMTDAAIITTPLPIFADIRGFSRQTSAISGSALAEELLLFRNNPQSALDLLNERVDLIESTSATRLSAELHYRISEKIISETIISETIISGA